jgi:cytochrome c oxidase subunit 5b
LERLEMIEMAKGNAVRAAGTSKAPRDRAKAKAVGNHGPLCLRAVVQDPFGLEGIKWGPLGTHAAPRKVPSHFEERIVGCCCTFCAVKKGSQIQAT